MHVSNLSSPFQFNVLRQSSYVPIPENVFHLPIDVMVTMTAGTIQMKTNAQVDKFNA